MVAIGVSGHRLQRSLIPATRRHRPELTQRRKEILSRPPKTARFSGFGMPRRPGPAKGIVKPGVRISSARCGWRIRRDPAASRTCGAAPVTFISWRVFELDDVLKLPATMDVARARALFDDLMPAAARLLIDASGVEKASALAIEVLIA
jgi:hypothetical protein